MMPTLAGVISPSARVSMLPPGWPSVYGFPNVYMLNLQCRARLGNNLVVAIVGSPQPWASPHV